jgi:hypothetical protein
MSLLPIVNEFRQAGSNFAYASLVPLFSEEFLERPIHAQSSSSYETVFIKINHILDDTGSEYLELYEDNDSTLPVRNRLRSWPFGINEPINR